MSIDHAQVHKSKREDLLTLLMRQAKQDRSAEVLPAAKRALRAKGKLVTWQSIEKSKRYDIPRAGDGPVWQGMLILSEPEPRRVFFDGPSRVNVQERAVEWMEHELDRLCDDIADGTCATTELEVS